MTVLVPSQWLPAGHTYTHMRPLRQRKTLSFASQLPADFIFLHGIQIYWVMFIFRVSFCFFPSVHARRLQARATKGQSGDVARCARQLLILAISPIHALQLYRITYIQEIEGFFSRSHPGEKKKKHKLSSSVKFRCLKRFRIRRITGWGVGWGGIISYLFIYVRVVRNTKAHLATSTEGAQKACSLLRIIQVNVLTYTSQRCLGKH